jgi:hypothetical protein
MYLQSKRAKDLYRALLETVSNATLDSTIATGSLRRSKWIYYLPTSKSYAKDMEKTKELTSLGSHASQAKVRMRATWRAIIGRGLLPQHIGCSRGGRDSGRVASVHCPAERRLAVVRYFSVTWINPQAHWYHCSFHLRVFQGYRIQGNMCVLTLYSRSKDTPRQEASIEDS